MNRVGPEFESAWRRRFRRYAERFEEDAAIAGWSATGLQARVRRFLALWEGGRVGERWVDAGCGAGTYARILNSRRLEVVALDYSVGALQKARARSDLEIHWVAGDVKRLPFETGTVDGILCLGVTQALADSRAVVSELARIVREGGQVWIDGLNAWCLPHLAERLARRAAGRSPHLRYESPWRTRTHLRRAGLEDARIYWLPILPGRFQSLQRLVETPLMVRLFHLIAPLGAALSHSFIVRAVRKRSAEATE